MGDDTTTGVVRPFAGQLTKAALRDSRIESIRP